MNAKNLLIFMIILTVCLSACAPAMKPTIIAEAPREESQSEGIIKTVEVQVAAEPAVEEPVIVKKEIEVEKQPLSSIPKAPMPESNFFQDYGVNPFEDPLEDHLSTFALDVDTASYTVARRYVTDGNIPPSDSVRVEEFINYFNQGYSNPADIAFGIYADAAPSPFHYDGTYLLRIGIQGYAIAEEDRKPVSLTFVIDTSGSMKKENRLELVKQSLEMLVDRLRPTDTVSIVSYGSEARVILSPTSGEDRQMIMATIYSLYTSGSTNAEAGLTLGYDMANRAYRRDATNRVILCSDGVANVGNTGPDAILNSIGEYALQGIYLTSVGFGMGNFNDVLMEQLADRGNGNYAYVDNLDEAEKLFVDDLTSTLQVIALDAKVQVDFNPEVVSRYRLIGYENRAVADQDFRDDSVDAGELGAGHSATALYAVQLHPEASGRIATVQLRWQNPETGQVQEINGNFNTWDLEQDFYASDPYYQLAVVVAQYAEILRSSPWARESSIDRVLEHAFRIAGLLPQESEVSEFAALVSRASQIKELSRR